MQEKKETRKKGVTTKKLNFLWDQLDIEQKTKINLGLQQLKEGKGFNAYKITSDLKTKYRL